MIHKEFIRFWQLSRTNKLLILQAVIALSLFRLLIQFVPFRKISPWLGKLNQEGDFVITPEQFREIRRVQWAVVRLTTVLPWLSTCLTRAITAKLLLSQQHINATLYLGAAFNNQKALNAHAWLRCGKVFVVGGKNHKTFGRLVSFT